MMGGNTTEIVNGLPDDKDQFMGQAFFVWGEEGFCGGLTIEGGGDKSRLNRLLILIQPGE